MQLTKVLNVLVGNQGQRALRSLGSSLTACAESLVDDDAVGQGSRQECESVAEAGDPAVVVERDVGEAITDNGENQGQVSAA